jgi:RNA recognition motif-containing protein
MEVKLYVGNLSYDTTEADLEALFAKVGQVASVALITDRDSGRSKGFAFIEMTTQTEAEQAISKFNGFNLDNRELKVNIAKPREDRGSRSSRQSGRKNRR